MLGRPGRWPRRLAVGAAIVLALGVALYVAAPHPPATPGRAADLAEVERQLQALVDSGSPPGLSVVVVKDGELVYNRAYGWADESGGMAATPDTVYHWWSMTKIPTAMAVLQLVEQGRLSLDSPVKSYLPWFEVEYPSPTSHEVTVRHLLNHSSGLPDTIPAMIGWVHQDHEGRDQTALVRKHLPSYSKLQFEPGSRAAYSNLNYMVLGATVEAASGQSYESYVVEHVLRPLRMSQTGFLYTNELAPHQAAGTLPAVHFYTPMLPFLLDVRTVVREQRGRMLWLNPVYLDVTPSSGLIGSAPDASRLMLAYLGGGQLDGERVLAPETIRAMTYEGRVGDRGLGWEVSQPAGRLQLQHIGGGPGFATVMRLYPEEGLGVAILSNGTDLDRDGLADLIASLEW